MLHRVPRNERWVLKTGAERGWEEKGVLVRKNQGLNERRAGEHVRSR